MVLLYCPGANTLVYCCFLYSLPGNVVILAVYTIQLPTSSQLRHASVNLSENLSENCIKFLTFSRFANVTPRLPIIFTAPGASITSNAKARIIVIGKGSSPIGNTVILAFNFSCRCAVQMSVSKNNLFNCSFGISIFAFILAFKFCIV